MSKSKLNKSWERGDFSQVHSPDGIANLKKEAKNALSKKYRGIAQSMFRYDFGSEKFADDGASHSSVNKFTDLQVMSADRVPERFVSGNGKACFFEFGGQIHCLPFTYSNDLNIYGLMTGWHPVPVGYIAEKAGDYSDAINKIRNMELNAENSVIMFNDRFGESDDSFIETMVNELVDNLLSVNQLQLLSRAPFHFNVSKDNELSAKNYFHEIAEGKPAVFTNAFGDNITPAVESTGVSIDPALFEIYDRWECMILEHIGIPCVPITKRAQQTVSEVTSADDKIYLRRLEKLTMREKAVERINAMFGTNLKVVSVIDENIQKAQKMNLTEKEYDDNTPEEESE